MRKFHRSALAAFVLSNLAIVPGYTLAQDADAQPAVDQPAVDQQGDAQEGPPPQEGGDVTELQAVVVSGQIVYRNRTETTAPELVYGQEFFAEFEPVSVGDQLRRVPGVAFTSDIGESDAPQLRGLGQGFTQVLVNGRPIPGAGNDRTVFVDRIPAEIVDRIEIIRSPSADIDSQGIGGSINIILKDGESLPPGVIARVGVTHDVDSDKSRGNGALSWSGHNKDDTVFYSLTLDAQERFNNKDVVEEVFESDSVGFAEEVARHGIGRSLARFDDPAASSAVERTEEQDSRDSRDVSFNGDLTWRISDDSSLRLDAFALTTERKEHQDTQIYEGDGSVGGLDLDSPELEFQDADFRQKSYGVSVLLETYMDPSTELEFEASYNRFRDEGIEDTFEESNDNLVNREDNDADDVEWSIGGSVVRQMDGIADALGINGAELKVGMVSKNKDRDYRLTIGDDLGEDDFTVNDGRFDYKERRFDAYALVKWELNDAINLETGLRAENTRTEQRYSSDFFEGGALQETVSGQAGSNTFMLNPSAHVQWKIGDNDQLRFSAARTVRRPSIDQLIPAFEVESPGDEDVTVGNPDLEFETSIGFDLGYERRLPKSGIFGANVFYRRISDLIGLVNTGQPASAIGLDPDDFPGALYTYRNIGDAKVHGIEFDLSTPLAFMGLPETGVFANYTRLWSDRDDPATGDSIAIDFQPSYVYNVGLTQNIPNWDASFGFSYQKQGESRFVTYGEIESQLYDGNLEVFVEKRLSKNVVMRLTGSNVLDADSRQAEANFDGDNGAEIIDNQATYNVDGFEVERENSSPKWTLTLRAVF